MEAPKFALDVWGKISNPGESDAIEAVMVTRSPGGGWLFHTVERGSRFDVWLETLEEVEEELERLKVKWPAASSDL
ncbi:MAG: hypothetical protein IPG45_16170 [Deltaproteobacteria bacterium]|nr:hypothetical protein [Deltaproteobacteria bacterium]